MGAEEHLDSRQGVKTTLSFAQGKRLNALPPEELIKVSFIAWLQKTDNLTHRSDRPLLCCDSG